MNNTLERKIIEFGHALFKETSKELSSRYIDIVEFLSKDKQKVQYIEEAAKVFESKDYYEMFDFLKENFLVD